MSEETAEGSPVQPPKHPNFRALERADVRVQVIRAIAMGDKTNTQIARDFGVTESAIRQFKQRHEFRIDQVRKALDNEYAGIALASKVARVATYSDQVLKILEVLEDPAQVARAGMGYAELARVAQQGMRSIADELGQIPTRSQVEVSGTLNCTVNGVELDALR